MRIHAQKQNQAQQQLSSNITWARARLLAASHVAYPVMHAQRAIGNQAVQRLSNTNAEGLEVGSDTAVTTRFAHDFSRIPVHSKTPVSLQAKLAVNTPGDIFEQEADRVAEQVTNLPEQRIERACACGGGCHRCQNEQATHEHLQAKHVQANNTREISAPPLVNEVLRSSGQPLDRTTQGFMESRFGHDFSRVRVHTDVQAAEAAWAVKALAFTVGKDVVFGAGRYAPQTATGRQLLAHELTHVVQQAPHTSRTGALLQRQVATTAPASDSAKCPQDISEEGCCNFDAINKALSRILEGHDTDSIDNLLDIPIAVLTPEDRQCCCYVICHIVKPGRFSYEGKSEKYDCDCPLEIDKEVSGSGLVKDKVTVTFRLVKVPDLYCPQP